MDVSQRVAEALEFRGAGTARIKVDYIGRAAIQGSDDNRLMATLRTDGSPAEMDGMTSAPPGVLADAGQDTPRPGVPPTRPAEAAAAPEPSRRTEDDLFVPGVSRLVAVPLPPSRPFSMDARDTGSFLSRRQSRDKLALEASSETRVPRIGRGSGRPLVRDGSGGP